MNPKSFLRRPAITQSIGFLAYNGAAAFLNLLLLPIISFSIGTEEYGVYALFMAVLDFCLPLTDLNLISSVSVEHMRRSPDKLGRYIVSSLVASGGFLIAFCLILSVIPKTITDLTALPMQALIFVAIAALLHNTNQAASRVATMDRKVHVYGVFRLSYAVVFLVMSTLFATKTSWGWRGLVCAQLLGYLTSVAIVLIYYTRSRYSSFKISLTDMKESLNFGVQLMPTAVALILISVLDRLFIKSMIGIHAVGIYAFAYRAGLVVALTFISLNQVWVPFFFKALNDQVPLEKIVLRVYQFGALLLGLAAVFFVVSPFLIVTFLDKPYHAAKDVVPWVGLFFAANALCLIVQNFYFYYRKNHLLIIAAIAAVLIDAVMNYTLIPLRGMVGAAQATLIAYLSFFLIGIFLMNSFKKFPWLYFLRLKPRHHSTPS
jgi:O-antigen/teichoic acid export membrane protein